MKCTELIGKHFFDYTRTNFDANHAQHSKSGLKLVLFPFFTKCSIGGNYRAPLASARVTVRNHVESHERERFCSSWLILCGNYERLKQMCFIICDVRGSKGVRAVRLGAVRNSSIDFIKPPPVVVKQLRMKFLLSTILSNKSLL